ncbi:MAG: carboxylating nicotinate-nucleotide diphosphorylase [candidate division WOR-3 bacterium]
MTSRLTVPRWQKVSGRLIARSSGVLSGLDICRQVFHTVDCRIQFTAHFCDGCRYRPGAVLAQVSGRARSLLAAERTALNFLQRMSGIATMTADFVAAVKGTGAAILDTRKTVPGWRLLDKYAVRCGGGQNHRLGLYDAILIKDNHIAVAGSISDAVRRCQNLDLPVIVECHTVDDVREAIAAGVTHILLDNMPLARLRAAVATVRGRAKLEASGGVTLRNVRAVAETGVDYISVGSLTHSAPAADIALDFERVRT